MEPAPDLEKGYDLEKGNDVEQETDSGKGTVLSDNETEVTTPNIKNQEWMSLLPDSVLLSSLTLPGTHDSAAYTQPWPYIATQTHTILQQLDSGIRYFDLRCGNLHDKIEMVHGPRLLNLSLFSVLEVIYTWLSQHPSEGIILQIKEDRRPENSTISFPHAIFQFIASRPEMWRVLRTTPTLGELRGKIQLFRRYHGGLKGVYAVGIDVTRWEDNPKIPFTIFTDHGVALTIQDHYKFSEPQSLPSLIASKGGDVSGLLERASKDDQEKHWYVNFASAYEFNLFYQLTPRAIALGGWHAFRWEEGMNVRLRTWLAEHESKKKRYGIVVMDFPNLGTADLVELLVKANFDSNEENMTPMPRMEKVLCTLVLLLGLAYVLTVWAMWAWFNNIEQRKNLPEGTKLCVIGRFGCPSD